MMLKRTLDFVKTHRYGLALTGLFFALCAAPLLRVDFYTGHDFKFHLCRISCISDNINNGVWFSPIYRTYLQGYGYAAPLFYGDTFLHIPGFLVSMGMEITRAFKFYILFVTAATAFSAYFCAKAAFKDKAAAFTGAAAYTFSSYFVTDAAVRTAVGELTAFIFLPILFLGFYSIVFEDMKKWYLLPLGLTGCLVSHVLSAVISVVFLTFFALLCIKRLFRERRRLYCLFFSALAFFCFSAFFFFPLLEQFSSHDFAITNGSAATAWGKLHERTMPLWAIFCDLAQKIKTPPWIPNGIGLSALATATGIFYAFLKKWKPGKLAWGFFAAGAVTILATTGLFPWKFFQPVFESLQFPWRLLTFATFFFAGAAGLVLKSSKSPQFSTVFMIAVVGFSVFSFVLGGADTYVNMIRHAQKGENAPIEYENTIGAGEYMPVFKNTETGKWVSAATVKARANSRGDTVKSNTLPDSLMDAVTLVRYTRTFESLTAEFANSRGEGDYLEFPLIMYKGYYAEINGVPARVDYGANSLVRVYIGDAEQGKAVVWYKGTALQKICNILSVSSFFLFISYLFVKKYRENINAKKPYLKES